MNASAVCMCECVCACVHSHVYGSVSNYASASQGCWKQVSPGEEMRHSRMRRLQTRECANSVFSRESDRLNRVRRQA